ncbi:unnamed protein product [Peniophora sp. CBMAI 1063]|nr:unnamed protein product [Peniophora sp. CBMAI 1063]
MAPSWSVAGIERHTQEETHRPAMDSTARLIGDSGHLGWIRLIHVCSSWRSVGLSMASLWGYVFPIFPDDHISETILALSRDQPLSLDMDLAAHMQPFFYSPPEMVKFFTLAEKHLSRARILTFPRHLNRNVQFWDPSIMRDVHLPHLKILRLYVVRESVQHEFTIQAPALTHLVLGYFAPFAIVPSLTYLKITDEVTRYRPVTSLLDMLRATPLLEELSMQWVHPSRELPSDMTVASVRLPKLSTARFSGPPISLMLVKHLELPRDADLTFWAGNDPVLGQSIWPILDVLDMFSREPSINYMSLRPDLCVDICLATSREPGDVPAPRISLRTVSTTLGEELGESHTDPRATARFLSELISHMEPANITTFHVSPYTMNMFGSSVSEEDLIDSHIAILHCLTGLKTLSVGWLPTRYKPFFVALARPKAIALEPFELGTLIIFSEDSLSGYDFHPYTPELLVPAVEGVRRRWNDISIMLENRCNAGKHLKHLVLEGLRVDEDEFGRINAEGLRRVAAFVDEVVDRRLSTTMNSAEQK